MRWKYKLSDQAMKIFQLPLCGREVRKNSDITCVSELDDARTFFDIHRQNSLVHRTDKSWHILDSAIRALQTHDANTIGTNS